MSQLFVDEKSFERGLALMDLERWEQAIPFFTKAHSQSPEDVNPVLHLARCFSLSGKLDEALSYAEKGIELVPDFEFGHRLRSIILAKLERFDESLESALEASRFAPEKFVVIGNLANAYLRSDQPEKAKETAELLVQFFPEESRAHEKIGDILLALKELEGAEKAYREAIRLNPENSRLRHQLGVILLDQYEIVTADQKSAKRNEALKHFSDSLQMTPDSQSALYNLKISLLNPPDRFIIAAFVPFFILGLIVTPIWSVGAALLFLFLYKAEWNDYQKQVEILPSEMRKTLTPNFYENDFTIRPNILFPRLKYYLSKIYRPLLLILAIAAGFYYSLSFSDIGWLPVLFKIIFVLNLLWIIRGLFQTPNYESQEVAEELKG